LKPGPLFLLGFGSKRGTPAAVQAQREKNLASIFRTIHTIKGGSGFLSFGKLEAVAHVGEICFP
jgi:chemotaxis protein histidine kinase CheA